MDSGFSERHLVVRKTARYFMAGEPSAATRELWLACHGFGQLAATFAPWVAPLASAERVVVAPEGLHRYYLDSMSRPAQERRVGASWMTREDRDHDIADNRAYLDQVCAEVRASAPGAGLFALGFSQGAATVARWAVATDLEIERLALWGAGLPPDLDWARAEHRLRSSTLVLVAGEHDPFLTPQVLANQRRALDERGIPYQIVGFPGGHEIDAATLLEVARRR